MIKGVCVKKITRHDATDANKTSMMQDFNNVIGNGVNIPGLRSHKSDNNKIA